MVKVLAPGALGQGSATMPIQSADHAFETSGDRLALVRRRLELGLSRGGRTRGGKDPDNDNPVHDFS
ncbi:MAG: hypothetical protein ABWZ94_05310 [Methyloceanibacter sp.]